MKKDKSPAGGAARMKIGVLEELSGLTRDTIHYYLREGLLHRPNKSGATVAWYDGTHLARLLRIRALRSHGLSLSAIRRVFSNGADRLGPNDLALIGALLTTGDRAEQRSTVLLSPRAKETAKELGLVLPEEEEARWATALEPLAELPPDARSLALTWTRTVLEAARETALRAERATLLWLLEKSPDAASLHAASVRAALRNAAAVATDAAVGEGLDACARGLMEAAVVRGPDRVVPRATEHEQLLRAELSRAEPFAAERGGERWERCLELAFSLGQAKRLQTLATKLRRSESNVAWVSFALGVGALDAGAALDAVEHFEEALVLRPGWPLARVALALAELRGASIREDGVLSGVLRAVRGLERAGLEGEAACVWARWLRARVWLSLPTKFGTIAAGARALEELLRETEQGRLLASGESQWRVLRGNVLLAAGEARKLRGDAVGAQELWKSVVVFGGALGEAARALVDGGGGTEVQPAP